MRQVVRPYVVAFRRGTGCGSRLDWPISLLPVRRPRHCGYGGTDGSRTYHMMNGGFDMFAWVALFSTVLVAPHIQSAQTPQEREVVAVVERFFQGMLERDAEMLRSTVAPSAVLMSVSTRNGQSTYQASPLEQFITAVTTRQGEPANERIYAPRVEIDGSLAHVWTFYTLHVGEQFSHCGYDSFQLLRGQDGWKIVSVADSRRTENCEPPGG